MDGTWLHQIIIVRQLLTRHGEPFLPDGRRINPRLFNGDALHTGGASLSGMGSGRLLDLAMMGWDCSMEGGVGAIGSGGACVGVRGW